MQGRSKEQDLQTHKKATVRWSATGNKKHTDSCEYIGRQTLVHRSSAHHRVRWSGFWYVRASEETSRTVVFCIENRKQEVVPWALRAALPRSRLASSPCSAPAHLAPPSLASPRSAVPHPASFRPWDVPVLDSTNGVI